MHKLIKYFYIFLTILVILSPVKSGLSSHLLGVLFMWGLYFIFTIGVKNHTVTLSKTIDSAKILPLLVSISYFVFYPSYVRFYTGQNITLAILSFISGASNYYQYQEYFIEAGLNSFSLEKLPFILGHGILRFLFIAIVIRTLVYQNKVVLIEKVSLFLMTVMIVLVGFSRGTSFELFELSVLYIYAVIMRRSVRGYKKIIPFSLLMKLGVIVLLLSVYFVYNIQVRMGEENFDILNDPNFDKDSFIFLISPPLALILYSLYGYFVFGIYFTSTTITKLWFGSIDGFLSMFIPRGMQLFQIDTDYRSFIGNFIDLGAKWNADTVVFVERYGIVLFLLFMYFIGFGFTQISRKIESNIGSTILLFYISYAMISLPVGNFISSSSANIVAILLGFLFYKYRSVNKFLFNYLIP